jgi:HNH endonuclease
MHTTGNRCLMHRYIWENEVGTIPEGWDIHHIDEDKSHNELSNFECLPKSEHTRLYSPHNNQFTKGRKRVTH